MYHPTVDRVKNLLASHQIEFDFFDHEPVRTSEEAAKVRTGYSINQGAKALIVKVTGRVGVETYLMLVLPGDKRFDSKLAKSSLEAKAMRFATEAEVSSLTQGVQVGGVPPFGSLFSLQTFVDPLVLANEKIVFNAGDRCASIGIASRDYLKVENPTVLAIVSD